MNLAGLGSFRNLSIEYMFTLLLNRFEFNSTLLMHSKFSCHLVLFFFISFFFV